MVFFESLATMIGSISLIGSGMALGIIGLIVGVTRGMSPNKEMWAITFATFATFVGIISANVVWGTFIFLAGATTYLVALNPMVGKLQNINIYQLGIIGLVTNIILGVTTVAYISTAGAGLGNELNQNVVQNAIIDSTNLLNDYVIEGVNDVDLDVGICIDGDTTCESDVMKGTEDSTLFDVWAGILAIGSFILKALIIMGYTLLGMTFFAAVILPLVPNAIVATIIGFLLFIWNVTVLYRVILFVTNKRGT